MKYISPYKIYESFIPSDIIKDDIKYIFIDLIDDEFDIKIDDYGKIEIIKSSYSTHQPIKDSYWEIKPNVTESILRLIDYLSQNKLYLNELCNFIY